MKGNVDEGTIRRLRKSLGAVLVGPLALCGCDSLLEVELPGQIVEEAVYQPAQAVILVNSAIGEIECYLSNFLATSAGGFEDNFIRVTGWGFPYEYQATPSTAATCNPADTNGGSWWTPLQKGRFLAETALGLLSGWTVEQVPNKNQLLVQSAIYAGIAYNQLGDYFCEIAVDAGPLMSPDETLAIAEQYLTDALAYIDQNGDFQLPAGISSSAEQMARVLRARVRWARGDMAGAVSDGESVQAEFVAYATRDAGGQRDRWNRVYEALNGSGWGSVMGPIDWWPVPGSATQPFTGFRRLAVLPDGRAISDAPHYPITLDDGTGAVMDVRTDVEDEDRFINAYPKWSQRKYGSISAPIPLANWEEVWLIRAEAAGGQGAIDLVNEIRDFHNLPRVTYLAPDNEAGIRAMIIEERRRSLFLEGRFWATKLKEDLFFPQGIGVTEFPYPYFQGKRMVMPNSEFVLNPNLEESDQGTLCGDQRPYL